MVVLNYQRVWPFCDHKEDTFNFFPPKKSAKRDSFRIVAWWPRLADPIIDDGSLKLLKDGLVMCIMDVYVGITINNHIYI